MVNIEKLNKENFSKVADKNLTFERAAEIFEKAGFDTDKVIIDPTRFICNIYYADYESGLYFDVRLSEDMLQSFVARKMSAKEVYSSIRKMEK